MNVEPKELPVAPAAAQPRESLDVTAAAAIRPASTARQQRFSIALTIIAFGICRLPRVPQAMHTSRCDPYLSFDRATEALERSHCHP